MLVVGQRSAPDGRSRLSGSRGELPVCLERDRVGITGEEGDERRAVRDKR